MCVAHVAFQIYLSVEGTEIFFENPLARVLALFDLIQISQASCGAFHILPDVVVFVVSSAGLYLTCKKRSNRQDNGDLSLDLDLDLDQQEKERTTCCCRGGGTKVGRDGCCGLATVYMQMNWTGVLFATSSIVAVTLQPTLVMLPLALFLLVGMYLIGTRAANPHDLLEISHTYLLGYLLAAMITQYIFQIVGCGVPCCLEQCDPMRNDTNVSPTPMNAVGLVSFSEMIHDAEDWRPLVSFFCLILSFWSLSLFRHVVMSVSSSQKSMQQRNIHTFLSPGSSDLNESLLGSAHGAVAVGGGGGEGGVEARKVPGSVISDDVNGEATTLPSDDNNVARSGRQRVLQRSGWMSIFVLTIFAWGLWFPSLLILPPFLYSTITFVFSGTLHRPRMLRPFFAKIFFLYLLMFVLVYGVFSTPYLYSSVALGCPSCSIAQIRHTDPVRIISMLGLAWIQTEGQSGSPSFHLFIHCLGLFILTVSLRSAIPKHSGGGESSGDRIDGDENENVDSSDYYAMRDPPRDATKESDATKETKESDATNSLRTTSMTWRTNCSFIMKWLHYTYLWVEGYAFVLSLGCLYVFCLLWVDFIHSLYMIFCLAFVVSPRLRQYWRILVVYSSIVLVAMYVWNIARSKAMRDNHWALEIGIESNVTTADVPGQLLFGGSRSFLGSVIIFLIVCMQMPLFIQSRREGREKQLAIASKSLPKWMMGGSMLEDLYQKYGLGALCVALLLVGLNQNIRLTNLTSIMIAMALLWFGLMWTKLPFDAGQPRMFRMLFAFSVLKGVELLARYLMQYKAMCGLMTSVAKSLCVCTCFDVSDPSFHKHDFNCVSIHYNSTLNKKDTSLCVSFFQEIGLNQYPVKDLFMQLFFNALIFAMLVLETQVSYNRKKKKSKKSRDTSHFLSQWQSAMTHGGGETKKSLKNETLDEEKKIEVVETERTDGIGEGGATGGSGGTSGSNTTTTNATTTKTSNPAQWFRSFVHMSICLLFHNSGKINLLFAAIFALCWRESMISLVIILVVLINLQITTKAGETSKAAWWNAWCLFFPISCLVIVLEYFYQFSLFRVDNVGTSFSNVTSWIGFKKISLDHSGEKF